MKIILTNDDGFDHPGIKALFKELHDKHEVFLIGPDQNRSGFSSAITFLTPLRHKKYADNIFSLNGTPVDCVKVARNMLCPFEPEDRQALLEAPSLSTRRETLVTLIEFALRGGAGDEGMQ